MTTTTRPVTIDSIPAIDTDSDQFRFGMTDGLFFDAMPEVPDGHPAVAAWERVMDETLAEVGPEIARVFTEAVERRLPWTWEPER